MASIITTPSRKQSRAAFALFANEAPIKDAGTASAAPPSAATLSHTALSRAQSITAISLSSSQQPQSIATLRTARANSIASKKSIHDRSKSRLFASPSLAYARPPSLDNFKQVLANIAPVKPSKTSGGHYWGHLPPIHQPWSEDDYRFPINAERMYSHKVLAPNWYEERVRAEQDFIKPVARYLPDRCFVSDYHENISAPARYYSCYDRRQLTGQLSEARMRQLRGGVPPILVRSHQDALEPTERADRLNSITHVDIDLQCQRDKHFGNVPRQPARHWGLEGRKRLKWIGELRGNLGAPDNTSTYQHMYDKKGEHNDNDAMQYLAWLGHDVVKINSNDATAPTVNDTGDDETARRQQQQQHSFANNPLFGDRNVEYVAPAYCSATQQRGNNKYS